MKMSKKILHFTLFFLITLGLSGSVLADDVEDYINEALQFYKDGQLSEAVSSLNFAEQLIQQEKGSSLEAFLPEPLSGWEAQSAKSQAAGSALLGGCISAEREYNKGESYVRVSIVADSPILQTVMMMFQNPAFAASDGGKMERIGKQKAIVKVDPNTKEGEIQIIAANRFLVTVEGNGITDKDLKAYAQAIDYDKMAQLP